ncbi:hypothetical protein [Kribbella sp. NPDC051770]|uniref:hypothetical protein n=1 Tax=Kribbella sp. NPDC051770 TaxID=3155413 RepID=UPI0034439F51
MNWVPDACTLPTAEQPLRVAEFDRLFARALRGVRRTGVTTLELDLAADARAEVEELVARESECCSFFTFRVEPGVLLVIDVPAERAGVLDALVERLG